MANVIFPDALVFERMKSTLSSSTVGFVTATPQAAAIATMKALLNSSIWRFLSIELVSSLFVVIPFCRTYVQICQRHKQATCEPALDWCTRFFVLEQERCIHGLILQIGLANAGFLPYDSGVVTGACQCVRRISCQSKKKH